MRILLSAVGGAGVVGVVETISKSLGGGLMNALGNLKFGFQNLGTEGTIGMDAIKSGALGVAGVMGAVGVAAGVAAVAIGTVAVKAAGDFQQQTERLVTSAGELQSNLGMVRQGILQMSVDTATSTAQLSQGMYYVESSGFHAASGLNVLKVAAMGAKSENADLDTVAKALTTTMIDYHMSSGQASDAMNGLIATVQSGKTSLQDLSASMGNVLPIASALHISFPQVAGAMDTMTNAGQSAHLASMNLSHVLVALQAPSKIATTSMTDVGLSAQQVKDALVKQGLPQALQLIEDHVGKKFPAGSVAGEQALKNILGGMVGLKTAAMLTGKSLDETKDNIAKVTGAMKNGHGAVMGWTEVQGTFNFKMDQAKQSLNVLMITIGTALLPVVGKIVDGVTKVITAVTTWIVKNDAVKKTIDTIGTVLGTMGNFIATAVTDTQNITSAFGDWWKKADPIHKALDGIHDAVGHVKDGVNGAIGVVQNVVGWFQKWHTPILAVSGAITLFFLPAIIKVGVEAAIAGGKIAANFVQSMITTGTQATINGAKTSASFVASLIKTGVESVVNGAKTTASFVAAMAKAGVEAVVNGAKITASFVAGIVKAGIEGWSAAGKLALVVAQFIATGVQAAIAGAKMAAQFIANIVKSGISAVVTAGQFVASLIPAIISFIADALTAAATAIPAILAGFGAWIVSAAGVAIANIAAFWPIYLIILAIAAVVAIVIIVIKNWGNIMSWFGQLFSKIGTLIHIQLAVLGVLFQQIGTIVHNVFSAIGNFIGGFFSGLGTKIHNALAFAGALFSAFGDIANTTVTNIVSWFENFPGQVLAFIQNFISSAVSKFQGLWNQLISDAKSILGGLGSAISGVFKGAINLLITGINFIIDQIDKISVNTPFGHVGFSIPHIPFLAMGGIITAPGLAVVGEAGPELVQLPTGASVAPLTRPAFGGAGGIGGGPIYYITINLATMARSQSEVRNLVTLIEQELGRRVRATTPGYNTGGIF